MKGKLAQEYLKEETLFLDLDLVDLLVVVVVVVAVADGAAVDAAVQQT